MKNKKNAIWVLCIALTTSLLFFGFKSNCSLKKDDPETVVHVFMDSIPPGPITKQQLLKAKTIRVTSPDGTINYKVKSFNIGVALYDGPSEFRDFKGHWLFGLYTGNYAKVKHGDFIEVSHLVIENLDKFKADPDPKWTIMAENK